MVKCHSDSERKPAAATTTTKVRKNITCGEGGTDTSGLLTTTITITTITTTKVRKRSQMGK